MTPTWQSEVDLGFNPGLLTLRPIQGHHPRRTSDSISDAVSTSVYRHHDRSGKAEGSEPNPRLSTQTWVSTGESICGEKGNALRGDPGVGWSEDPRRLYLK